MSNSNQDELLEDWPRQFAGSDESPPLGVRDTLLLQDRPKSKSCSTLASFDAGDEDDDRASANHIRTVRFAETSQLYVYERERLSVLRSLSYTDNDRHRFGREAMLDGLRIKILVDEVPLTSVAESMTYLLRHGIIARDEVVGIEHFCYGTPTRVATIRMRHAAAVLRKQQQLLREHKVEDAALILGMFAQSSSWWCTQSARIRAGIAACHQS